MDLSGEKEEDECQSESGDSSCDLDMDGEKQWSIDASGSLEFISM